MNSLRSCLLILVAVSLVSAAAPKAIVARTLAGKGVSFMEGQIKWHYLPMSDGEYEQAMAQIAGAP